MNLTVFAGTFNPIHVAHLIVAEAVRTELNAEKILFIPSFIPPHKADCRQRLEGEGDEPSTVMPFIAGNQEFIDLADAEHRLNMVNLAIKDNPHFKVSDIELKLQGISYTYKTIQEIYRQNTLIEGKINFIIGADAFNNIETWHKYEEMAKLINFIVLARPKSKDVEEIINNLSLKDFSYKFVEAPRIDISSSYIRQRIKEKKSIKYLVTNEVENYIIENKLYLD